MRYCVISQVNPVQPDRRKTNKERAGTLADPYTSLVLCGLVIIVLFVYRAWFKCQND